MFYKFYKVKNDSQQDIEPLPHSYSETDRSEKEIEPEKKKDIKKDTEKLPHSY
ncbi:MAG: hypothetical protein ACN23H_02545 [Candidatus Phytoplasma vitis]|nr:MAG: hypothetical protein M6G77_01205 [Candidatus Phytoplasma vitis]